MDAERLLQHEFAAIGQQRGKLSEDLIHRMNSNLGKGGIPVALRLRGDDVVSTRQPVSAESAKRISKDERRRLANEAQLRNHAAQRARYVRSQEAVLSMARVRDPRAHGTPEMGTVYANLIESEIRELAAMPEVEEIGVVVQGEDLMGNALDTTDVNPEVHVTREFRGDEVRVGIVDSSGRVRSTNPPFSGASITQGNTAACYGSQEHSTPVAGVIVGQDADNPGIAPAALLYAAGKCDGSSSAVESETTNAINWGVSIMNVSWGGEPAGETNRPNDTDKWFDRQVIDGWKFLTVAAGNRGAADCVQGSDGRLLRPALGYNVLTVGNFNDRNSAEWGGDTPDIMAPCSSWVNPDSTRGDRAKPEVAAPGTNLWTARGTDAAPWMGNSSGTSVAAPFVAGLSALMIQADPVLDGWPEVVKAIIIATARHNIEGSSVFSEFDGAGGVYSLDAVRLAALEFGDWHGTSIDCSSAFPVLRSLPLVAGRQTRVAIAWDQNPDYANDEFRPSADHDLVIVNDD